MNITFNSFYCIFVSIALYLLNISNIDIDFASISYVLMLHLFDTILRIL